MLFCFMFLSRYGFVVYASPDGWSFRSHDPDQALDVRAGRRRGAKLQGWEDGVGGDEAPTWDRQIGQSLANPPQNYNTSFLAGPKELKT